MKLPDTENKNLPVKKSFLGGIKNKLSNSAKEAEQFMLENIAETFLPKLKKLLPIAQRKIDEYLGDRERIIVMQKNSKGQIVVKIFKHPKVDIIPTDPSDLDVIEGNYTVDEVIEMVMKGELEAMVK